MATQQSNHDTTPALRDDDHLHAAQYGAKIVEQTGKIQEKAEHVAGHDPEKHKEPAGGFDGTPIPKAPPGHTVRITFHAAKDLPFADLSMTSDPYIFAVLKTDLPKRHKQDPDLMLRTPTIHRNTNPVWNTTWTIAHVPASGFHLKLRLYDEDPADHDDRLGNVHVNVDHIDENWKGFKEESFKIKKRMGSKRAYTLRGCASLLSRNINMSGQVVISVENLGRSEGENGGQPYTVGPLPWSQHHSPLIGMIAGTKDKSEGKKGKRATERYNFRAVQMQLRGPVPEPLYHRYVEFKPFIAGMFTSHTLRGRILNHAAHHQHARIYNFDETTKYGSFDKPCREMSEKFLEFVQYDQGGRIFTYVLTLDGQFRFTETGKEFGIDMLSKHTMHSNVSIYIAFSGEFFIRRLKHPRKDKASSPRPEHETTFPAAEGKPDGDHVDSPAQPRSPDQSQVVSSHNRNESRTSNLSVRQSPKKKRSFSIFRPRSDSRSSMHSHATQTHEGDDPSKDISQYELIIDNDSGTYRPNAKYLGQLKKYFKENFPGLKVVTLDCQKDEEKMKRLKAEQGERKKNSGQQIMYMQNSSSDSFSSSDEEELNRRASGASRPVNALSKAKRKVKGLVMDDNDDDDDDDDGKNGADISKNQDGPDRSVTGAHVDDSVQHKDKQAATGSAKPTSKSQGPSTPEAEATTSKEEASASHTTNHLSTANHHASRPQTALSEANLQKNNLAFEQNQSPHSQHPLPTTAGLGKSLPSDIEDRQSFNTAFTDNDYAHTEQFVTPKPSLGDGGLRQFDSMQNLSEHGRVNNPENVEDTTGAATPVGKGVQLGHVSGDVTPTANGHVGAEGVPRISTIHHTVTSAV